MWGKVTLTEGHLDDGGIPTFVMAAGLIALGILAWLSARRDYKLGIGFAVGAVLFYFESYMVATMLDLMFFSTAEYHANVANRAYVWLVFFVASGAYLMARGSRRHVKASS